MERAKIYDAVYNFVARNRQDNKKSIDYAELSEPDRKIYDWLRELEIKF